MRTNFVCFVVGVLFALGLGVSGMTQPPKVAGFLDVFGNWDASLMFVMIGAIAVHMPLYFLIRRGRQTPILAKEWHIPQKKELTRNLILGSVIFGVGWGLAGYCPGPGIVSLASFGMRPILFVVSMLIGMMLFKKSKISQ